MTRNGGSLAGLKILGGLVLLGIFCVTLFGPINSHKNSIIQKPLAYLIPGNFVGPVFVFFGQKDGIEVQPDPMGNIAAVPPNGLLKLRGTVDELIPKQHPDRQNVIWATLDENGKRRIMLIKPPAELDANGKSYNLLVTADGQIKRYPYDSTRGPYYYLTESQKRERMIWGHGRCKHQRFAPEGNPAAYPECGKFLVASPLDFDELPPIWRETSHEYDSMKDLEDETEERFAAIREYFKKKASLTPMDKTTGVD